jgi:hypothetical protein
MTNSVKFTIASSLGVEEVTLVQNPTVLTTINATINDSSAVHAITNAFASRDGTQVEGETGWWWGWTQKKVNLSISPPTAAPQTTGTLSIADVMTSTGSMSAADGAAVIAFVQACALPPIP